MTSRRIADLLVTLIAATLALPISAHAASVITREFRYAADRVSLSPEADGFSRLVVAGGVRERRAGYPDVPCIEERVELPADMKLARVEVETLETERIGEHLVLSPATEFSAGSGVEHRTEPDAARYARPGFEPEIPVRIGYQGNEREHRYAWLEVAPVRWDAASGRVERVTRLVVRLVLEPTSDRPLLRERIVPEWEHDTIGSGRMRSTPAPVDGPAPGRNAEPFKATQVPSLLGSPVAYVIVTSDSLAAAFQPLADWKIQSGVPAVVRTLGFIRSQYPSAVDDPERVRNFIRDAYTRWGTRWVLLGGDVEIIPPRLATHSFLGVEHPPSDLYFSCLDGNWNADGDSVYAEGFGGPSIPGDSADLLPEVWVGRAPVATAIEAQRFVLKTLTYEKTPVSDYMNNVLFFAQVISPVPWHLGLTAQFDGADLVEQDMLPILDQAPSVHAVRLYQNNTAPQWRPGALPESRAVVLDSLERGYNLTVHIGHGYREVMSCGDDNLTNNDVSALTNGNRLMNFYAIDCTSNAIDFASIGEALMRAPAGGAVTNIGSTTLDYPTFGRVYQKEYFRLLFEDSVTAVGEAQGRQKLPFLGQSYYDGFDRLSQLTLLLLGDPELRIFTATPRELTVTAPSSVLASDSTVTVHVEVTGVALFGARVTALVPGHEYRSGLTDGAGNITLPFRPDGLGSGTLTVTAFNARPWQQALDVVAGTEPALHIQPAIIVDDGLDGRHGNANAVADAGELIDLGVAVRNAGGTAATGVSGTLSTADPQITITSPAVSYGSIDPGTTASPSTGYRLSVSAGCPDQHEVAFTLDLVGDGLLHRQQRFQIVIGAPELLHLSHTEVEESGNGDGQPQPGETVGYAFRILNAGTGEVHGLSGHVRSVDGLSVVLDSVFTVPDLAAGAEGVSTPVRFVPSSAAAHLDLEIDDADGARLKQTLDIGYPGAVGGLSAIGGAGSVRITWAHSTAADLKGYNVARATSAPGPYGKVTPAVAGRIANLVDAGLAPLTRYYYQVSVADSSGNESAASAVVSATTGPAYHAGFPARTLESSDTPVAFGRVEPGATMDILAGGQVLHLFHADGTFPVDADGSASTPGDLSTVGRNFTGGGSISDLDRSGSRKIAGAAWDSKQLVVVDALGQPSPGFPVSVTDPMWSSVAIGDLNNDGHKELVFAGLSHALYAFRSDGGEWRDGDANPATIGVFTLLGGGFNVGTPALADLEGTGVKDIVYGTSDGFLDAWRPDGSNVPGFPIALGAAANGSAAIGKLDGAGGPYSIVVPLGDNSLRAYLANGTLRSGFPVFVATTGTNHSSSPAIADMNNDGFKDVVFASTDGRVVVVDRNGAPVAPWTTARFSALTAEATQSSPVVADINGDGLNDVVVGDESGYLSGLSGADGVMLPGFPIKLDAEASGTPAVCDCDGDGKTEIVDVDYGGTVHVWDYDFAFSPAGPPPWPQFQHDSERTGCSETPAPVDVGPPSPAPPAVLELAAPQPNPARGTMRLVFGIPAGPAAATLEIEVFDLAGRHVRTLARGLASAGRRSVAWDLRGDTGEPVMSGMYLIRLRAGSGTVTRKVIALR